MRKQTYIAPIQIKSGNFWEAFLI